MSQWDSRRGADLRGTHKLEEIVFHPSQFLREVSWNADLRTGRPPVTKAERLEQLRVERQDRTLAKMMGHEI